ncbi:hypothetical protein AAFF_G00439700 [Aldrovandia affinis]|uniref:Uncharacterized protein n=1 Tax=Aldrovandia affinis TaxID=143900 RepID=A0AAD7WHN3_9TELE|nr:hypothetical protein AAFF_G00439700 [Aldrovandia affinis]
MLTTSMSWDYQCKEEIPEFNYVPLRDGELGHINGGISLSQVIQQLDKLNVTRGEKTPKLKSTVEKYINLGQKLPPSISEIFLPTLNTKRDLRPGSATCCSYLGSSSLQGPLQRQQPGLKCNKTHGFWFHHPKRKYLCTSQSNQRDRGNMAQSEIPLTITPALVTHSPGLSDRRGEGRGTRSVVSSTYCLAANKFEGFGAGTSSSSSTGQSSSSLFTDFPSDDSDLSDQEKASVTAQGWAAPVDLDLRPDPIHEDDPSNYLESAEDQSSYPEVLPAPLKILDPAQNLLDKVDCERRQSLHRQDSSLCAFASRLAEMERMQVATFLKEKTKAGRSRPITAISMMRSTTRMRKADLLGSLGHIIKQVFTTMTSW